MNLIDMINKKHINPNVPDFQVGDTVRVDVKIKEGKRERIQAYEGIVTARKGGSVSETFTVILSISGLFNGNTLLIPTFPLFFLTVNVSETLPPLRAVTIPS